ncbi:hypothetical protein CPB86DRAFT_810426 [Serendipita vermifera]|nr:hypothetical protein CPB86DRAFT_810426 [Serendipita vermifera]
MSKNWQYVPISSQDADLISINDQLGPAQSTDFPENERKKLQSNQEHDPLHKKDTSQMFTNAAVNGILEIPNWPGPQMFEVTRGQSILYSMGYMLFLIPPLFFLVLVAATVGLHLKEANALGAFVRQAYLLGPTVFPITFSAILGWCLKAYGRYRAERGVKLGQLERVIGSQTVFSFLRFAFAFKQFDRLCIILGVLWSLSPLGGQGILRMLSMRQVAKSTLEDIFYLDLHGTTRYMTGTSGETYQNVIDGLYVASLFAPGEVKNSTTDLWGGIKIPFPNSIDSPDWDNVTTERPPTYVSLLGVTVDSRVKTASNSTFSLNTTFFTTQCEEPKIIAAKDVPNFQGGAKLVLETEFFVNGLPERNLSLSFITSISYEEVLLYNCTVIPNFALAKVECHSGDCRVSRIKRLADPDGQLTHNMLNQGITWPTIVKFLPTSTGPQFLSATQTECYLHDPRRPLGDYRPQWEDLRQVPIAEFNKRFAVILNTYYQATIAPSFRLNSLLPDDDFYPYTGDTVRRTVATIRILLPQTYQRHWEWVISAFVASLAMLGVAMTGILLEKRVISPDIYGYVSSMTRDNPYFPLPPTGCALDGTQRAVLLRDVVVRFEDVAPNKRIGHLALTMVENKASTQQSLDCRLRRTKMYSGCS